MAFEVRDQCPSCREKDCITIESRVTRESRRRRKECQSCEHRHTSHEVSEQFFEEAVENKRLINYLIDKLKVHSVACTTPRTETPSVTCDSCIHMSSSGCGFDFPEAGDDFAAECPVYNSGL
jgi:transcriptional regulator NrdR family protein